MLAQSVPISRTSPLPLQRSRGNDGGLHESSHHLQARRCSPMSSAPHSGIGCQADSGCYKPHGLARLRARAMHRSTTAINAPNVVQLCIPGTQTF